MLPSPIAPRLHLPRFSLRATSATSLPRLLDNSLVAVSVVPLLAVGEKPVDDDAADGEDEDEDRPEELVADGAGGLEDLDWVGELAGCAFESVIAGLTPDEDVEHQDNEADDSAAGTVLRGGVLGSDGCGGAEGC